MDFSRSFQTSKKATHARALRLVWSLMPETIMDPRYSKFGFISRAIVKVDQNIAKLIGAHCRLK